MAASHSSVSESTREQYLSPAQVCEMIPGMTKGNLAALRFQGKGPRFIKPSPKVVVYAMSAIETWLSESERTGTAQK